MTLKEALEVIDPFSLNTICACSEQNFAIRFIPTNQLDRISEKDLNREVIEIYPDCGLNIIIKEGE